MLASLLGTAPNQVWRLNPFWQSTLTDHEAIARELKYFFPEGQSSLSFNSRWDAFKIHASRVLDMKINRLKKSSKMIVQLTAEKLQELEEADHTHPSPENLRRVKLQARTMSQLYLEKARQKVFFCKARVYEHVEKAGKLLAYLAHLDDKPKVVVSLTGPDGRMITDPPRMADTFLDFYSKL